MTTSTTKSFPFIFLQIFLFSGLFFFIFLQNSFQKNLFLNIEIKNGIDSFKILNLISKFSEEKSVKISYIKKNEQLKKLGKNFPEISDFIEKNNLKNPLPESILLKSSNIFSLKKVLEKLGKKEFSTIFNQNHFLQGGQIFEVIADKIFIVQILYSLIILQVFFIFLSFFYFKKGFYEKN